MRRELLISPTHNRWIDSFVGCGWCLVTRRGFGEPLRRSACSCSFNDVEEHTLAHHSVVERVIHNIDPQAVEQSRHPESLRIVENRRFRTGVQNPRWTGAEVTTLWQSHHLEIVVTRPERDVVLG